MWQRLKINILNTINRWGMAHCWLCHDKTLNNTVLCQACHDDLPWITHACAICALPLAATNTPALICGDCLQQRPHFDRAWTLFHYQSPIDHLITALKFHEKLSYTRLFADQFIKKITHEWYLHEKLPECIIPIPLHKTRLQERGFNQALELARPIAKTLHIPLDYHSVSRIRATAAQSSVPAAKRLSNIKQCFQVNHKINVNHVAIIDDVMTTGNTVDEFARVLRQSGVNKIDVWCCARTTKTSEC